MEFTEREKELLLSVLHNARTDNLTVALEVYAMFNRFRNYEPKKAGGTDENIGMPDRQE
jgi:hypothetical protein